MLYKFNNLNKLEAAISKFRAKNPAGAVYRFDQDNWEIEKSQFQELLASGRSLFGDKNLIILRGLDEEIEHLSEIEKANLERGETVVLWFRLEVEKPAEFDFFALSNALTRGDRAALWLGYQRALVALATPEEVFWRALWWPVRKRRDATLSARLVRLWHETKREEGRDFGLELERFLLTI